MSTVESGGMQCHPLLCDGWLVVFVVMWMCDYQAHDWSGKGFCFLKRPTAYSKGFGISYQQNTRQVWFSKVLK